jgi:hypothetical protein
MSASGHYTGNGRTKPTLATDNEAGFPEFLGPNRPLTSLKEVAIIGLGSLRIED